MSTVGVGPLRVGLNVVIMGCSQEWRGTIITPALVDVRLCLNQHAEGLDVVFL